MVYPEQQDVENITPQIQIKRFLPSQIDAARPDIVELITRGYGHENRPLEKQREDAVNEFNHGEDRTIIYLAENGDKAVAALIVISWKNSPEDKRGSVFWPKLAQNSPEIYSKALAVNPLSLDIASIVSLPQYQRRGIAGAEILRAISDLHPAIITGQTKTPGAVLSLAQSSAEQGYRTFYGNAEVTPGRVNPSTSDHQAILKAYLLTNDDSQNGLEPEGVVYAIGSDFVTPEAPDVSKLYPVLQTVFAPVIRAQKRIGNKATVFSPLISVKSELLE